MKYFISPTGSVLGVENPVVLAQMENHPESYTPCDKDGKPLKAVAETPKKVEDEEKVKAPKKAKA